MTNGIESLGRIRAQGIAIILLSFVVGVLVGFAGERLRATRAPRPFEPKAGWWASSLRDTHYTGSGDSDCC